MGEHTGEDELADGGGETREESVKGLFTFVSRRTIFSCNMVVRGHT